MYSPLPVAFLVSMFTLVALSHALSDIEDYGSLTPRDADADLDLNIDLYEREAFPESEPEPGLEAQSEFDSICTCPFSIHSLLLSFASLLPFSPHRPFISYSQLITTLQTPVHSSPAPIPTSSPVATNTPKSRTQSTTVNSAATQNRSG